MIADCSIAGNRASVELRSLKADLDVCLHLAITRRPLCGWAISTADIGDAGTQTHGCRLSGVDLGGRYDSNGSGAAKLTPLAIGSNWPTGGVAIIKVNVTLLTFKCRSERPVSMRHFVKLADRKGSAAIRLTWVV